MCIKKRNSSRKVICSADHRGKGTQHCKESFACAWRGAGGRGGGLLVAVTSFCGGVSGMFSEIFVT